MPTHQTHVQTLVTLVKTKQKKTFFNNSILFFFYFHYLF
jgi:hypothetical protein